MTRFGDDGYGDHWKSRAEIEAYFQAVAALANDQARGRREFESLFASGSRMCAVDFGLRLLNGDGVPQDIVDAEFWLRNSAEGDFCPGLFALGMFLYGQGRIAESETVLSIGCNLQYPPALYWLGVLKVTGPKSMQNVDEALALLEESERVGHVWARVAIGMFELKGYFGWRKRLRGMQDILRGLNKLADIAIANPKSKLLSRTCM